ncbi:hypothetical protein [Sanguibacter sp. 25GB23B1]|uniref:hypothetical protein n=1 Tax=unclassified Sanguibacter TaxID=2645534 RepID=UPI0032AFE08A
MRSLERAQAVRSFKRLMEVELFVAAWLWGTGVVVVAVILTIVDRLGTVNASAFSVGSQVGMWFCFAISVLATTQYLPIHVAAGTTRRAFVVASIAAALLTAVVYAVVLTTLLQVERAVFDAFGWAYSYADGQLFSSTDQLLAVLGQYALVFAGGGLGGLLVGIVYYRGGAAIGTLALLVTVTPVLLVAAVVNDGPPVWRAVPLPDGSGARVGLVIVILVLVTAAYRLVARRVPITPAMG